MMKIKLRVLFERVNNFCYLAVMFCLENVLLLFHQLFCSGQVCFSFHFTVYEQLNVHSNEIKEAWLS